MQNYLQQLLEDIRSATANVDSPYIDKDLSLWDIPTDEEEDKTARVRNLQEWTGITQEMLPPENLLDDEQVHTLLQELKKMLDAFNWCFVLQIEVPERIQYETIRQNFDQDAKMKTWGMGFFEVCKPGTVHNECVLKEYCQCAFFAELFKDMIFEDLSPEEERRRMLDIEIRHIQRKYGDEWMKYYPYHLDEKYDDENGEPHDYGIDFLDDDDDDDDWWKK